MLKSPTTITITSTTTTTLVQVAVKKTRTMVSSCLLSSPKPIISGCATSIRSSRCSRKPSTPQFVQVSSNRYSSTTTSTSSSLYSSCTNNNHVIHHRKRGRILLQQQQQQQKIQLRSDVVSSTTRSFQQQQPPPPARAIPTARNTSASIRRHFFNSYASSVRSSNNNCNTSQQLRTTKSTDLPSSIRRCRCRLQTRTTNRRFSSSDTTTTTTSSTSAVANNNKVTSDNNATLINRLEFVLESPGGIDHWVNKLNDKQRSQLTELLAKAIGGSLSSQAISKIPEPSVQDLRIVVYTTAIPFVGFGIMDNAILIIAGDAIDTSLGVSLGISTMCAAAIGNIISDIAGIGLGTVIEDFCANHLKLPIPNITTAQRQLRSVRLANQLGCGIGIVVGCIIGMFPLLWIDSNKVQVKKREAHLDTIFKDVISQAGALVGAARVCLYLRVDDEKNPVPTPDGKYLYIKYDKEATSSSTLAYGPPAASSATKTTTSTTSNNTSSSTSSSSTATTPVHVPEETGITRKDRFVPVGRGIVSRALLTGESWNIVDVQSEPDFVPDLGYVTWDDAVNNQGRNTRTMICVPILDSAGRPIAVIQAINKIEEPKHEKSLGKSNDRLSQFLSSSSSSKSQEQEEKDATATGTKSNTTSFLRFTENDVQILKALASHISVSLQRMYEQVEGDEAEIRLHDTIQILKEYGLAGIIEHQGDDPSTTTGSGASTNATNKGSTTRFAKSFSNRPLFPDM